ncbi:sensor histidine kinase [Parapedobacter koreensis]|uniref:Two component regulator propeller n=1 Tax=Parapedobacter koreensis TaxID=332977 RepID=A0A1H7TJX6_9SPHI|nr:sensor histidine kinase [Parapedobacter koreensis]SEL84988.1 Two component regulator propeller [Parapedobacter koreensis]
MTYRSLSVSDGLPQSYISGIAQDNEGFMWIGTRDGLARYDGRNFKQFRHDRMDSASLTGSIISKFSLDRDGLLWIRYGNGGDIDILDVQTEEIMHLTSLPPYRMLKDSLKQDSPILKDNLGRHWMLSKTGELFVVDLRGYRLIRYDAASLLRLFGESRINGMAQVGDDFLLILDESMVYIDSRFRMKARIVFGFDDPRLYDPDVWWKDTSPTVRSNGDMLIPDDSRLILYSKKRADFMVFPLPAKEYYVQPTILLDAEENFVIAHNNYTFYLDRSNQLTVLDTGMVDVDYRKTAMCLDRSGVLWEGSNGWGIRQLDIYLKQMPAQRYTNNSFPVDILLDQGVEAHVIEQTFLHGMNAYLMRWARSGDGRMWLAKAGVERVETPDLLRYYNGVLQREMYVYKNKSTEANQGIDALALAPSGELWGLDHLFRPIHFDTVRHIATVREPIQHRYAPDQQTEIGGMVMTDDDTFWICNTLGLLCYNLKTEKVTHFFNKRPAIHLLTIQQDPNHPDILWLGTYSDGIIRFDTRLQTYRLFSMRDGLPNNTVYAILPGRDGLLWCSSNNGIFSINPSTGHVNRYTPQGISPLIECNRFHYFAFPNGQLAFGGTTSYTHFAPEDMRDDNFEPNTMLTDILINNKPAGYGDPALPLAQPINMLQTLTLPYYQNFLSFEFAALQFNAPEKLQYRYMLKGLDTDWVVVGNKNNATYTGIPPGRYILLINASNTSGKWSRYVKRLTIVIMPPFWKTWWFNIIAAMAIAALVLVALSLRLRAIRRKDQERMAFEREAMELKARALRSQMNPHFIFNCLNSIKALIQQEEGGAAITYLTIFSKLIRNQLSNSQQEITLQEELDTCRLYVQMEALRFGNKLSCSFETDPDLNLKLIRVPPLIMQPFVENAVIHGILPKEGKGKITMTVNRRGNDVVCQIDDDGVGRRQSALLKMKRRSRHESKGMILVEHRLKLHNTLNRHNIGIAIEDKMDKQCLATGTCVSLIFKSRL